MISKSRRNVLKMAGLAVVEEKSAGGLDEILAAAEDLGYPVVLKGIQEGMVHKTEAGLVELNLNTPDQVASAFHRMAAGEHRPSSFLIQPMLKGDLELIAGIILMLFLNWQLAAVAPERRADPCGRVQQEDGLDDQRQERDVGKEVRLEIRPDALLDGIGDEKCDDREGDVEERRDALQFLRPGVVQRHSGGSSWLVAKPALRLRLGPQRPVGVPGAVEADVDGPIDILVPFDDLDVVQAAQRAQDSS